MLLFFCVVFNSAAHSYKIKVTFHIEPYKDRTELTVKNDIEHIVDTYGKHPAFYKHTHKDKRLPLVYVYDSYHTKPKVGEVSFWHENS